MEDRLRIVLCVAIGAVGLSLVGILFGGIAGAFAWATGKSPGGPVGHRVLQVAAGMFERNLSRTERGAIVGAAEGALAFAVLGAVAGLWSGYTNQLQILMYIGVAALILAAAAALCGTLGYCLVWAGGAAIYTVAGLCCGLFIGAAAQGYWHFHSGVICGTLLGGGVGLVITILVRLQK